MLKPITAVLASFVLSLAVYAQSSNRALDAVTSDSPAFHTVDPHKGNVVRIDPDADWSRYGVYRFSPAIYQPTSPRHSLTARQVRKSRRPSIQASKEHSATAPSAAAQFLK